MNYEFCDGVTHTIKKGDTLYEISRKYRVPLALLLRANPYADVFNLQVGDTICVPANLGQPAQRPQNMAMRSDEVENQQETSAPPAAISQPGNEMKPGNGAGMENTVGTGNMVMPENATRPMGQPAVNLQRREDGYGRDYDDDKDECTKQWEKYVVQPGDTLADVMADMRGDVEDFVDKNGPGSIYLLPGVAYYICK